MRLDQFVGEWLCRLVSKTDSNCGVRKCKGGGVDVESGRSKYLEMLRKFPKYVFISLSAGLTFISLQAGFHFYQSLFGLTIAWTASVVFESLRFSTLYFILYQKGKQKLIGSILYAFIALTCSFAAISSFHARILENQQNELQNLKQQLQPQIEKLKQRYVAKMDSLVQKIDNDIGFFVRKCIFTEGIALHGVYGCLPCLERPIPDIAFLHMAARADLIIKLARGVLPKDAH